jgi:hypothetical protein
MPLYKVVRQKVKNNINTSRARLHSYGTAQKKWFQLFYTDSSTRCVKRGVGLVGYKQLQSADHSVFSTMKGSGGVG